MSSLWSLCLTVLFAVLVSGSGARTASRRTLALAAAISVLVVVAVFAARYYADELLGNHSVIRLTKSPLPHRPVDGVRLLTEDLNAFPGFATTTRRLSVLASTSIMARPRRR